MIERISETPAGPVGFRVAGEMTRGDHRDVLVPERRSALEAGGGLRTLYLIEDLDKIEPGALCADAKLGFDLGRPPPRRLGALSDRHRLGLDCARNQTVRMDDPRRSALIRDRRPRVGKAVGGR
jgi:hypothetical protein